MWYVAHTETLDILRCRVTAAVVVVVVVVVAVVAFLTYIIAKSPARGHRQEGSNSAAMEECLGRNNCKTRVLQASLYT